MHAGAASTHRPPALSRAARSCVLACAWLLPLLGCNTPPPNHALVVRNLRSKCALIAFSGCAAFADAPGADPSLQDDAGVDDDAGVEDHAGAEHDADAANGALAEHTH